MGVNKVIVIGNLGNDPETKHLESGKVVCQFSVAASESYKDKNGDKKQTTEWFNAVVWGPLAEVADKYLKKGSQVYLEGKQKTRSWEKDGQKHYRIELLVSSMTMLGSNSSSENNSSVEEDDDDLTY